MSEINSVICDHCDANISKISSEHHLRMRLIEEGRVGAVAPITNELPAAVMNFCNIAHLKDWLAQN